MDAVWLLQTGSAFLTNASFAWLAGAWFARRWLQSSGASRGSFEPALGRADVLASALCVAASTVALWAATAVMAGVGLREAWPMFNTMLSSTDYGRAGCITILAMLVLLALRWAAKAGRAGELAAAAALLAFALTRAAMGHAGESGLWTAALAAEAIHLVAIGVWTGAVLLSAWFSLNESRLMRGGAGSSGRYLALMSDASLAAVTAIFASGLYSAWLRVGSAQALFHSAYGGTLLGKVALVLVAIALGAYNKFVGMPSAARAHAGVRWVRAILRVESGVLLAALLAAAMLTAQQPPAAN